MDQLRDDLMQARQIIGNLQQITALFPEQFLAAAARALVLMDNVAQQLETKLEVARARKL